MKVVRFLKNGKDDACPSYQRYVCKTCRRKFDDFTGTIFSGMHYPLTTWIAEQPPYIPPNRRERREGRFTPTRAKQGARPNYVSKKI